MNNKIYKIGAAIIKNDKILVVKEAGWEKYGLPGGTIKKNEEVFDCLEREIKEELNADVKRDSLEYLGVFEDAAMNEPDTLVQIKVYRAELESGPSKTSEVEDMFWFGKDDDFEKLGPIDKNKILPALIKKGLIK
jgi:8-oxo-dGTP diphosphatase